MKCPDCSASLIRVVTTRHENKLAILRQRTCRLCRHKWITREVRIPGRVSMETWPPKFELEEEADPALRVQKLEAMWENEKAAVLDLYQQIDKLQQRLDWQFTKIGRLEDAAEQRQP